MLNQKKAKYIIYPLRYCFIKLIISNLEMLKGLLDVIVYQQQRILSDIINQRSKQKAYTTFLVFLHQFPGTSINNS